MITYKNIIFIDTETSGFWKPPSDNPLKDPWIVEVAAVLAKCGSDGSLEVLASHHEIIKSQGRFMRPHAAAVHGISQARADREGRSETAVMLELTNLILMAEALCCHNTDFDYKFIYDAMVRNSLEESVRHLSFIPHICTMKETTDLLKLPHKGKSQKQGYKFPKLSELYTYLFKREMPNAHSAKADINHTIECFSELITQKLIDLEIFDGGEDELNIPAENIHQADRECGAV